MTLTDFLLARITDDEHGIPVLHEPSDDAAERWVLRVLAECEAKRRIVEMHGDPDHACPIPGRAGRCLTHVGGPAPCATLRLLALPYADHPDYREEWRP